MAHPSRDLQTGQARHNEIRHDHVGFQFFSQSNGVQAVTGFANPWQFFDTYLDELTAACEAEVVPAWADRLAGVDIFTADHCYKLYMSLRID